MQQYTSDNLVIHPNHAANSEVIVEVTPIAAGWDTINFQARRLSQGQAWSFATGNHELALVVLGGQLNVESPPGAAPTGRRRGLSRA